MRIIESKIPIFIFNNPEHTIIKSNLLSEIESTTSTSYTSDIERISNTDWDVPAEIHRPYMSTILPIILKHLDTLSTEAPYINQGKVLDITSFWFQQYLKGDYHGYHMHGFSVFSSIYFVELPNKEASTTFDYLGNEVQLDIQEGDYILFPSAISHCSKPNKYENRKTVISLNLNGGI